MKAFASILVAVGAMMSLASVEANGLLGGLLGGGDGGSPFGPINIVGSPAIDVETNVGSPTTVIDKAPSKGGINIVTPSFVRVKTNVDSEKTEVKTAQSTKAAPSPPSTPFGLAGPYQPGAVQPYNVGGDPDIASVLSPSRPKPTTVGALASVLSSFLGGSPQAPPPAAPSTPTPAPTAPLVQPATQASPVVAPVAVPTGSIASPSVPVVSPITATPPAPIVSPPHPVTPSPAPLTTAPLASPSKFTLAPGVASASSLYATRMLRG